MGDNSTIDFYSVKETPLSCGKAGFLAQKLENFIHRHKLTDRYEHNIIEMICLHEHHQFDTKLEQFHEMFAYSRLTENQQKNAMYRLNASAMTIIDYDLQDDICQEINVSSKLFEDLQAADVGQPSISENVKNLFKAGCLNRNTEQKKDAIESLVGIRLIEASIQSYLNKAPNP